MPRSGILNLGRPLKAGLADGNVSASRQRRLNKILRIWQMANTYVCLYYHFIFSTKNRVNWISPQVEKRLWAYLGGIARKHKLTALQIGGHTDHIHMLVLAPATLSPSQMMKFFKGDSSRWVHRTLRNLCKFAWQDGYGAFTVGKSQLAELICYIQNQREHHRKKSFQEEYLEFLRKNDIPYDERYLWG